MQIKQLIRKAMRILPDKLAINLDYFRVFGKFPDLKNPKTFNEKLQWLKLHDRKTIYTTMVDKYAVKQYVAERIGEDHIVPTLGVWEAFDEIDFDALPQQFVLKCTHDCGGLVICKDKSTLDKSAAKQKIETSLKRNYYWQAREWPYKNVKPRIIAEKYLEVPGKKALPVYKIFNFSGKPSVMQVIQNDKLRDETIDYFDSAWNKLDLRQNYPNSANPPERPEQLGDMLRLAKTLSRDFPFLRTDFYIAENKVYFSEFTFYSDAGCARFSPPEWDGIMGSWIHLPQEKM